MTSHCGSARCSGRFLNAFLLSLVLLLMFTPDALWAFTPAPTVTTLTLSSSSVPEGDAVTFTATVATGGSPVTRGLVVFCNALAAHCEDAAILGTGQLTSSGEASLTLILGIGDHSIKAAFEGVGTTRGASTSTAQPLTVTGQYPTTTTTLAQSNGPGNYNFTGTVSGYGGIPRTGTLTMLNYLNHVPSTLATFPFSSATNGLNFQRASLIPTGNVPGGFTTGDFNGDGKLDVVVAIQGSNDLTVLLGNGNGSFSAPPTVTGPFTYIGGIVGDFNGDGNLDFATSEFGVPNGVFLGHGDGTFSAVVALPIAGGSSLMGMTADFNGDGILDLATVDYSYNDASSVTVLQGNGDGTFTRLSASYTTNGNIFTLLAADFNGDGIPDLATTSAYGSLLAVLLGNGDGTFNVAPASPSIDGGFFSMAAGDFNNDGKVDLAVSSYPDSTNSITILLGNGDGTFTTGGSFPAGVNPGGITLGDFNHDGVIDLVTFSPDTSAGSYKTMTVLLGNGDGTFNTLNSRKTVYSPIGIAVGDFNDDGASDIAIVAESYVIPFSVPGPGFIEVLFSQTTSSFTVNDVSFTGGLNHSIASLYSGDAHYGSSQSRPLVMAGTGVATTVTLTASPGLTIPAGQPVQFTATVTPASSGALTAAGTVSFAVPGGAVFGIVNLNHGQAILTTSRYAVPGTYKIDVQYSGDANFLASRSAWLILTITP